VPATAHSVVTIVWCQAVLVRMPAGLQCRAKRGLGTSENGRASRFQRCQSPQQAFQERSSSVPGKLKMPWKASQSDAVQRKTITVGAFERTFWLGVPPRLPAPLLVVLHGMGIDGARTATWTRLAEQGPAAGFATVFADRWPEVWDDQGFGRSAGADDVAFREGPSQPPDRRRRRAGGRVFGVSLSGGRLLRRTCGPGHGAAAGVEPSHQRLAPASDRLPGE
jgi:hypothetical protein